MLSSLKWASKTETIVRTTGDTHKTVGTKITYKYGILLLIPLAMRAPGGLSDSSHPLPICMYNRDKYYSTYSTCPDLAQPALRQNTGQISTQHGQPCETALHPPRYTMTECKPTIRPAQCAIASDLLIVIWRTGSGEALACTLTLKIYFM